jgi:hypothetical protein
MELIYVAASLSFVIGLLGYFIVRFWILPIGKKEQPLKAAESSMRLSNTRKLWNMHSDRQMKSKAFYV